MAEREYDELNLASADETKLTHRPSQVDGRLLGQSEAHYTSHSVAVVARLRGRCGKSHGSAERSATLQITPTMRLACVELPETTTR
jgi:hypothetical protein